MIKQIVHSAISSRVIFQTATCFINNLYEPLYGVYKIVIKSVVLFARSESTGTVKIG